MNAITNVSPAHIALISPILGRAIKLISEPVRRYTAAGDDAPMVLSVDCRPTPQEISEAQRVYPFAAEALRPATRDDLEGWLKRLNGAVRNPQDQAAFRVRLAAFGMALQGAPAAAFTEETLRSAMAEFAFFPSVADLKAFIDKIVEPMQRTVDAIRKMAQADAPKSEAVEPKSSPMDAEREAVAKAMAMFKRESEERRSAVPQAKGDRPTPRHLTDWQLLAEYEKVAGDSRYPQLQRDAAAYRARFLRAKLGLDSYAQAAE
jgi:hypothetical protein